MICAHLSETRTILDMISTIFVVIYDLTQNTRDLKLTITVTRCEMLSQLYKLEKRRKGGIHGRNCVRQRNSYRRKWV